MKKQQTCKKKKSPCKKIFPELQKFLSGWCIITENSEDRGKEATVGRWVKTEHFSGVCRCGRGS